MAKPIKSVVAYGFKGMNNLPAEPANLLDKQYRITPDLAVNVVVSDGNVLIERGGYTKQVNIPGMHSLSNGLSVLLGIGVDDSILYQIEPGIGATYPLATIEGPHSRLQYTELNNLIYMSNPYWNGVLELVTGTVRSWGVSLPPAPRFTLIDGDWPPGSYVLAYTQTENEELSGNGPLVKVSWEGGTKGFRLANLPTDGQCWITQVNGKKLMLAEVSNGVITGMVPDVQPLPTLNVQPPPRFRDFVQAFGRIWGINGKKLYYSESFLYEWFRSNNYIPFLEELIMVAPVTEGLYVNSLNSTWYLQGGDPAKMQMRRVGIGAIPGTLSMVQMAARVAGGAATSELFANNAKMPTPVWMSPTGFVVGSHGGNVTHLTENRLWLIPKSHGASLYRVENGIPQILTSLYGAPFKDDPDHNLNEVFYNGKLFD